MKVLDETMCARGNTDHGFESFVGFYWEEGRITSRFGVGVGYTHLDLENVRGMNTRGEGLTLCK